ncbi:MAG: hypothetical protein K5841_10395 [Fretibacterium sp.]|nr:hypothetical protein [Fretibacterium sp.]
MGLREKIIRAMRRDRNRYIVKRMPLRGEKRPDNGGLESVMGRSDDIILEELLG